MPLSVVDHSGLRIVTYKDPAEPRSSKMAVGRETRPLSPRSLQRNPCIEKEPKRRAKAAKRDSKQGDGQTETKHPAAATEVSNDLLTRAMLLEEDHVYDSGP